MDRAELATRAGVEPELVDRLSALGTLSPGSDGFGPGDALRFRELGPVELKGFAQPVPLFEAVAAGRASGPLPC